MDSLRGKLLIAAPTMLDPNFQRSVVLIAAHTEEGAFGLVLNRPSDLTVQAAAPELVSLGGSGEVVHVGGPVQPDQLVVVGDFEDPSDAALPIVEDVGVLGTHVDPCEVDARRTRVFAGHAGWTAGQLEAELAASGWLVEPARPDDVFSADAGDLWRAVLERKGGEYALLARMPLDPRLN